MREHLKWYISRQKIKPFPSAHNGKKKENTKDGKN